MRGIARSFEDRGTIFSLTYGDASNGHDTTSINSKENNGIMMEISIIIGNSVETANSVILGVSRRPKGIKRSSLSNFIHKI